MKELFFTKINASKANLKMLLFKMNNQYETLFLGQFSQKSNYNMDAFLT